MVRKPYSSSSAGGVAELAGLNGVVDVNGEIEVNGVTEAEGAGVTRGSGEGVVTATRWVSGDSVK